MSIYSNKKRWKWLLFFSAAISFVVIIYYSNVLMNSIANDELNKVRLWADAIYHKAELITYTEKFFEEVRAEERKKATLLAQAIQKVNAASGYEDITFYSNVIISNSTIPLIIVGQDGRIDYCSANVGTEVANIKNISELGDKIAEYDSIKIQYYKNQYILIYYKESKIYTNLRVVLDNLIQSFFQEVVINTASVPVIITDSTTEHIIYGNLDSSVVNNTYQLQKTIETMRNQNQPIKIELPNQGSCYVFYQESSTLTKLRYFPYVQFFIIGIFLIVAYLLFSFARRSEQNQVWVGMSKETAHQLGTPISSLMAWNELLKDQNVDPSIISEINKDVHRLETIAQRFSKIGSVPELKDENLEEILEGFVAYLQTRTSSKVDIKFNKPENPGIVLPLNKYLFEWVIENLCKNSIDAMDGRGVIVIDIIEEGNLIYIDIADTGKGIPANKHKTIFKPGYTSRSRGWGLGLTLAKRIVKEYHKGKLFVKSSVVGKGTVMRIVLKKGKTKKA